VGRRPCGRKSGDAACDRIPAPLFCGDTLHLDVIVAPKRMSSKGRGIVTLDFVGREKDIIRRGTMTFVSVTSRLLR
jgi:hypothetical protein